MEVCFRYVNFDYMKSLLYFCKCTSYTHNKLKTIFNYKYYRLEFPIDFILSSEEWVGVPNTTYVVSPNEISASFKRFFHFLMR